MGHGLYNCFAYLRGLLRVEVEPMKREELESKVAGFNHGFDSHGNLMLSWRHELDCVMCARLTDFIEKILWEAQLGEFGISCMDSLKLEEAQKKLARCIDNEINLTFKAMGAHPKYLEDYNEAEGVWYPKHDGESVLKRRARFYSHLPKGTTFGEARRLWNKST